MSTANFNSANKERGMPQNNVLLRIVFENSGEENQVPLSDLVTALTDFLDHFGEKSLVGQTFYEHCPDG